MLTQIMKMKEIIKNISIRIKAIETRSRSITPTSTSIISTPQVSQVTLLTQSAILNNKR